METWSSSRPPRTAPSRIEAWTAATISPPAASGASSAFWDIQVIQITDMAVFIAPQMISSIPTAIGQPPTTSSPAVTGPMTRAGRRRSRETSPVMKRPEAQVPTKPAQPSASRRIDRPVTPMPVTCSRKGRK